jgi:hypothetical protein
LGLNFKDLKKLIVYTAIVLTTVSCLKNRNEVRIRNNFQNPLLVKVGPTDFGTVKSVSTTEYKKVPDGKQEITGEVSGSITFEKRTKGKYTININTNGIVTLIKDAK